VTKFQRNHFCGRNLSITLAILKGQTRTSLAVKYDLAAGTIRGIAERTLADMALEFLGKDQLIREIEEAECST